MNKLIIKYACFLVCILLLVYNAVAQEKKQSFDLFFRETDNSSIAKINTNTDERLLLLEEYEQSPYIYFATIDEDTIVLDSINNILASYIIESNDTSYYYPVILANSVYYINDTLFVSFGRGLITYIRKDRHFEFNSCYYFEELKPEIRLSTIVGYKNGKLVLSSQVFNKEKSYIISLYDIQNHKILKQKNIYAGNSILLHYYDIYNAFSSNENYISFINTIEPKVYLYDYNLELVDSIAFSLNEDYKKTQHLLDTNVSVNQKIISPEYSKSVIMLLDKLNILDYYSNFKHSFIDNTSLIIFTQRRGVDTCDIIKLNMATHDKQVILSFPKYGTDSPFTALIPTMNIPLFSQGMFVDYTTKLDDAQEKIIYSVDLYFSDILNFSQTKMIFTDKKNNEVSIELKDYEGVIVFDDYFCRECFVSSHKNDKLLFIYYNSDIDKARRLSIYNELKKIYPNSDILFNYDSGLKVKCNQFLTF